MEIKIFLMPVLSVPSCRPSHLTRLNVACSFLAFSDHKGEFCRKTTLLNLLHSQFKNFLLTETLLKFTETKTNFLGLRPSWAPLFPLPSPVCMGDIF